MTEVASAPRKDAAARVWLLITTWIALVGGWAFNSLGLFIWLFGAPVRPLIILGITIGFLVLLTLVVVVTMIGSRRRLRAGRSSWWIMLIALAIVIAGWITAGVLIEQYAFIR
jgi:hypothetical protein